MRRILHPVITSKSSSTILRRLVSTLADPTQLEDYEDDTNQPLKLTEGDSIVVSEVILDAKHNKVLLNNGITFILASQPCGVGQFGAVYPAYRSATEKKSSHCVKISIETQLEIDFCIWIKVKPADLTHEKNVLRLIGRGACLVSGLGETPAMLTEWQPGIPLSEIPRIDVVRYSLEDRLEWFLSLILELEHLSKKGVVHQDLTQRNCIVDRVARRIRLIDFGLSRACNEAAQFSQEIHNAANLARLHIFPDINVQVQGNFTRIFQVDNTQGEVYNGIRKLLHDLHNKDKQFTHQEVIQRCKAQLAVAHTLKNNSAEAASKVNQRLD